MSDFQEASLGFMRDTGQNLVHFGAVIDGVFHPIAAERGGDFDERVQVHQQQQAQQQQSEQAQQEAQQ